MERDIKKAIVHAGVAIKLLSNEPLSEEDIILAEGDLQKALEAIQTLKEMTFGDLEVGDEFWNVGGSKFGVRFKKLSVNEAVTLSGHLKDRLGRWSPHSLVYKVLTQGSTG